MGSPYWFKFLINKTFSQRFFWAKLTNYPIIGKMIDYALFDGDSIFYLPKDKTIPINESVDQPENLMAPSQIVEHFIKKAGYHWIMDFCICRDSTHCKDYPTDLGCLFLGEAATNINPKFGRLVTKKEALDHAKKCRDAGLVHLVGRNKLDTVWLNVGPGEKLMTICNCCPCCCLWKVLPVIKPDISAKISRLPGLTVSVTDQCIGCGTCTENICFVEAIQLADKHAIIDQVACKGCGRCVTVCPNEAIDVTLANSDYISASIEQLTTMVDVT